jgi:ribosomal protein S7
MKILKEYIKTSLLTNGKKQTSEKIFKKSVKQIQKQSNINHKLLIKKAVIFSICVFKIEKQSNKRGKRRIVKEIPFFISNKNTRKNKSLKNIRNSSIKNKELNNFYKKFSNEILLTCNKKSESINNRDNVNKHVLSKKRYLNKFKW